MLSLSKHDVLSLSKQQRELILKQKIEELLLFNTKTIIMNKIFIKEIKINKVRHLQNMQINITNKNKRKHLIITGKNGSGKTSLLNEIRDYLEVTLLNHKNISNFSNIELSIFNNELIKEEYNKGNFILAYFDAKRTTQLQTPNGIQKMQIKDVYQIRENANQNFIQYLVNLKAQRSFARDDNNLKIVEDIDYWFNTFENYLKKIFEDENLKLEFDSKNFDFNIIQKDKEKFNLNTLSDGYSAILNIITELIMRMENKSSKTYELQGVVLIDEMETHLHIDLQKIILPFLINVFPHIQFIVTTHSPFIINSIENAVIYDLEHQLSIDDLSGYSVEGIIESYFNSDKYSSTLKKYVLEYEKLNKQKKLSDNEKERLKELKIYFKDLSKFMAPELELKIQQIELLKLK